MDKRQIVQAIIDKLTGELARYLNAAKAAQDGAADEQSRAENKYDTRGLEAAYLAHGQSRQIAETQEAINLYTSLAVESFAPETSIGLGTLVTVAGQGEQTVYFMGPASGGAEIACSGVEVVVITPHSPLGRSFFGRKSGDVVVLGGMQHRIVSLA